jgi:hypothetical protein
MQKQWTVPTDDDGETTENPETFNGTAQVTAAIAADLNFMVSFAFRCQFECSGCDVSNVNHHPIKIINLIYVAATGRVEFENRTAVIRTN